MGVSYYDISEKDIEGDGLKKTEQLTDSMFYIMAALTKPRHGYAIMSLIEETTKGVITIGPASMYTIIKKLLNQEWIYLHDQSDSRRKTYQLTEKGSQALEEDLKVRKRMIALAEAGLEEREE